MKQRFDKVVFAEDELPENLEYKNTEEEKTETDSTVVDVASQVEINGELVDLPSQEEQEKIMNDPKIKSIMEKVEAKKNGETVEVTVENEVVDEERTYAENLVQKQEEINFAVNLMNVATTEERLQQAQKNPQYAILGAGKPFTSAPLEAYFHALIIAIERELEVTLAIEYKEPYLNINLPFNLTEEEPYQIVFNPFLSTLTAKLLPVEALLNNATVNFKSKFKPLIEKELEISRLTKLINNNSWFNRPTKEAKEAYRQERQVIIDEINADFEYYENVLTSELEFLVFSFNALVDQIVNALRIAVDNLNESFGLSLKVQDEKYLKASVMNYNLAETITTYTNTEVERIEAERENRFYGN